MNETAEKIVAFALRQVAGLSADEQYMILDEAARRLAEAGHGALVAECLRWEEAEHHE